MWNSTNNNTHTQVHYSTLIFLIAGAGADARWCSFLLMLLLIFPFSRLSSLSFIREISYQGVLSFSLLLKWNFASPSSVLRNAKVSLWEDKRDEDIYYCVDILEIFYTKIFMVTCFLGFECRSCGGTYGEQMGTLEFGIHKLDIMGGKGVVEGIWNIRL